ncbi:hypothetical protein ABPG75_008163 [Micractinium tetrahymenae]
MSNVARFWRLACPLALLSVAASALPAPKPVLGYNTWNAFRTNIDEQLIRDTADRLVETGLAAAGYTYLNIDDGWSEKRRDGSGCLVAHRRRFPSGMAALAEHVHSRGLRFGIYGDAGKRTCAGYPGSRGHEEVDAETWAQWGVDLLKYDNCNYDAHDWDPVPRYTAMRDALNATGRPITFSLCNWGWLRPWLWADKVGHSWRTTGDIEPTWDSMMEVLDANADLARFSWPDRDWGDADMLEVGNGKLTLGEQRAHFALWALLKSPLLIGTDLRSIHPDSLAILKAREVIAINQDSLGVPGDLVWVEGDLRVYAAPLAGGSRAVVLLNAGSSGPANITVSWTQLGLPAGAAAAARDLFGQCDLGDFAGAFSAAVPPHDVAVLRLAPLSSSNSSTAADNGWRPWHQLHAQLPPRQPRGSAKGWLLAGAAAVAVLLAAATVAVVRRRRRAGGSGWRQLGGTDGTAIAASGSVQLGPAVLVGPAVRIGRGGKPDEQV